MARAADYDVVVTDLKMPGIGRHGGPEEPCKKEQPDVIVVIFTGYANVETAREALKNGAFDYIPKPFTPNEIMDVVQNALEGQNSAETKMIDLLAIVSHELKSPLATVQTTPRRSIGAISESSSPDSRRSSKRSSETAPTSRTSSASYIDLSKMEIDGLARSEGNADRSRGGGRNRGHPRDQGQSPKMPVVVDILDDPPVLGDPQLLKIVVRNLLNNAIKYGRDDTRSS